MSDPREPDWTDPALLEPLPWRMDSMIDHADPGLGPSTDRSPCGHCGHARKDHASAMMFDGKCRHGCTQCAATGYEPSRPKTDPVTIPKPQWKAVITPARFGYKVIWKADWIQTEFLVWRRTRRGAERAARRGLRHLNAHLAHQGAAWEITE